MAAPTRRLGFASGSSTLKMICVFVAPMDFAASMTPALTSFRLDSTIRPMYGADAMISGGMMAFGPSVVPTSIFVSGSTITSRIRNGIERKMLMSIPSTAWTGVIGWMPSLSVTTRITPSGMPIRYEILLEIRVI